MRRNSPAIVIVVTLLLVITPFTLSFPHSNFEPQYIRIYSICTPEWLSQAMHV